MPRERAELSISLVDADGEIDVEARLRPWHEAGWWVAGPPRVSVQAGRSHLIYPLERDGGVTGPPRPTPLSHGRWFRHRGPT